MELTPLGIEGAWLGSAKVWRDDRGSFREWFQAKEIEQITGINFKVAQANLSHSHLGVVRGIHYSLAPEGQGKLVTCIAGLISDVIVDIRPKSKTFRKYVKVKLDGESGDFLVINSGLGHGFVSMKDESIVAYLVTTPYSPKNEYEINPLDDELGINWGLNTKDYILSKKDLTAMSLNHAESLGQLPK